MKIIKFFYKLLVLRVLLAGAFLPGFVNAEIYIPLCTPETLRTEIVHIAMQQYPNKTISNSHMETYRDDYDRTIGYGITIGVNGNEIIATSCTISCTCNDLQLVYVSNYGRVPNPQYPY